MLPTAADKAISASEESDATAQDQAAKVILPSPTGGGGRIVSWLLMILCLLLGSGGLLWEVGHGDVFDPLEKKSLAVSIQTWESRKALADESPYSRLKLMPKLNGFEQNKQPPGNVLLDQISFHLFQSWPDTTRNLVHRARIVSVFFAFLLLGSIFWAGHSVCGYRVGFLASLLCLTNPLFIYYGRIATPVMPVASMIVFSIASGLWAIRPLRPAPTFSRQALGWMLCGITIGFAVLTGGGIILPSIVFPLALILLICPNRLDHLLGLFASILLGSLIALIWALFIRQDGLNALPQWLTQMIPAIETSWAQILSIGSWRLWLLILWFMPWSIWLACAIFQAFSTSSAGNRGKLFIGWVWFVVSLPLLFLNNITHTTQFFLPIICSAAILVALLFEQSSYLAKQGRYIRIWRAFRWTHLLIIAAATIITPIIFCLKSPAFLEQGQTPWFAQVPWYAILSGTIFLALLALQSWRYVIGHHPFKAAITWCLWMLAASLLLLWPMMHSPKASNPMTPIVHELAQQITGKVYWLLPEGISQANYDGLLPIYLKQGIQPLTISQLKEIKSTPQPFNVFTPENFQHKDLTTQGVQLLWVKQRIVKELNATLWSVNPVKP